MNSIHKRRFQFAAGIAVIGALTLLSPRAAHALVARLVHVTRTVSGPAVTEPVSQTTSQFVSLTTPFQSGLGAGSPVTALRRINTESGLSNSSYTVPAGMKLVITDVDITAYGTGGAYILLRSLADGYMAPEAFYIGSRGFQQTRLSSGIVYPSGSSVYADNNRSVAGIGAGDVTVHGYLTAN